MSLKLIDSIIDKLVSERQSIWSVKQIKDLVLKEHKQKVSPALIRFSLKNVHGLSYRKIKRIPFAGNSEQSKVLRSLYAQKMLKVLQSGQRIINIDESWIPAADFRLRRWRRRGMLNTSADKLLSQKVNIITAMGSDGKVWFALTTWDMQY